MFSSLIGLKLSNPDLNLAIKFFLTASSSLLGLILPFFNAFFISLMLFSISVGIKRRSFPAFKAVTSWCSPLLKSTMAFISNASVITNPLKFKSSIKRLLITFFESVEILVLSKFGMFK